MTAGAPAFAQNGVGAKPVKGELKFYLDGSKKSLDKRTGSWKALDFRSRNAYQRLASKFQTRYQEEK